LITWCIVEGLFTVRVVGGFIFKLEEEGNTALLLHLPKPFAETAVFGSTSGMRC
jgi:hypothetical protein